MNSDWKDHFMEIAILVSTRSKDPSTKVGALVVDVDRRVLGMGYNGFPRHVSDDPARYENRETKLRMVVHAEMNAILNSRSSVSGCTLISTRAPCSSCAGVIIQSGVDMIITPDQPANSKWADDWLISKQMLTEAGVHLDHVELPRHGQTMEEYYENGIRAIQRDLNPEHDERCNRVMNICDESCTVKNHCPAEAAEDTISRLLRGKSI